MKNRHRIFYILVTFVFALLVFSAPVKAVGLISLPYRHDSSEQDGIFAVEQGKHSYPSVSSEPNPVVITVVVSSTQSWTDTGLIVAKDDRIQITASGSIKYAPTSPPIGPDGSGIPSDSLSYLVRSPQKWANSLVGNIAAAPSYDGKGFFVGSSFEGQVPIQNTTSESGKLLLGFNDGFIEGDRTRMNIGAVMDNSGSFSAAVILTPSPTLPLLPPLSSAPPVARMDPPIRKSRAQGTEITFGGGGTASNGAQISGYLWLSSKDGELSRQKSFQTSELSAGTHQIYFWVYDDRQKSNPDVMELYIEENLIWRVLKFPPVVAILTLAATALFGGPIRRLLRRKRTKQCPYCATDIPLIANRCPNCTSHLSTTKKKLHT